MGSSQVCRAFNKSLVLTAWNQAVSAFYRQLDAERSGRDMGRRQELWYAACLDSMETDRRWHDLTGLASPFAVALPGGVG
jgi:hypothetical protein